MELNWYKRFFVGVYKFLDKVGDGLIRTFFGLFLIFGIVYFSYGAVVDFGSWASFFDFVATAFLTIFYFSVCWSGRWYTQTDEYKFVWAIREAEDFVLGKGVPIEVSARIHSLVDETRNTKNLPKLRAVLDRYKRVVRLRAEVERFEAWSKQMRGKREELALLETQLGLTPPSSEK